jgi:hypothetical protein
MLTSRSLTTLLGTAPTARNMANPLNSLSLYYKKTEILISTILFLLILYILIEALSSI